MYFSCVIFGGAGFIGVHFSEYLLRNKLVKTVYILDSGEINIKAASDYFMEQLNLKNIKKFDCDVREVIRADISEVDLIVNLAAIHREPGHEVHEYYETNVQGAENVCKWAEKVSCGTVVFSSSIAPYGPSEKVKSETTIPAPTSAYGGSKLVAEKIHLAWQNGNSDRRLVIVRPGVVFGPGEGGNVSRMIKAVLGRYFFFVGNKGTVKAGVYIKELCYALVWVLSNQENHQEEVSLFNMTMKPAPTLQEYVDVICEVADVKRRVPSIPYSLLYGAAYVIERLCRIVGVKQPINEVRVNKLIRSNNVEADYLASKNYEYQYNLKEALLDWRKDLPEEW